MENWPKWRHQFQIHLATYEHIDDFQKFEILLESLGPDGVVIVKKLLLKLEITMERLIFDQVWWHFSELCWAKYRYISEDDPDKDLQKDRLKLQGISEKVSLFNLFSVCR